MITTLKQKDLKQAIEGNHNLYNEFSLLADKLRTIYTALGWTHMTLEFSSPDDTIEELTKYVFEALFKNPKIDHFTATGGLQVNGYFDEEGMLNLDYSFNLI